MTLDISAHNAALDKAIDDLARVSRDVRRVALSDHDANVFSLAVWLMTELIRGQRLAGSDPTE